MTIKTNEDIQRELNVEHLVLMGQYGIFSREQTLATYGLCGCVCTIAEKDSQVMFGHFSLLDRAKMIQAITQFLPDRLTIVCPGEWQKDRDSGKYKMQAKSQILQAFSPTYIPYSEMIMVGETLHSRAVIWREGKVHHCF